MSNSFPSSTKSDANEAEDDHGNFFYFRNVLRRFWLWECAGCLFSLACLATISGILTYENGRKLDEWRLAIPLNAVVAFIALLAKGSLAMVLSSILSQLKWLDFKNPQYLRQLKSLDRASRGPFGSFLFLWTSRRTTILASLTAFLTLLALLLDPFIQIVLTFPSEFTVDPNTLSAFPRNSAYHVAHNIFSFHGTHDDFGEDLVDGIPEEVITGFNNGLFHTKLQEAFTCPSGNCLWPDTIKTVAIEGHCDNITTQLRMQCTDFPYGEGENCAYQFPSSRVLTATIRQLPNGTFYPLGSTIWNSSDNYEKLVPDISSPYGPDVGPYDGSFFGFEVLRLPSYFYTSIDVEYRRPSYQGYSCDFRWSEKTFQNVQVSNGVLSYTSTTQNLWSLIDLGHIFTESSPHFCYLFLPDQFLDHKSLDPSNWAPYLVKGYDDYDALRAYLRRNFYFSYPTDEANGLLPDLAAFVIALPDLDTTVVKIAESLTEMIRTSNNSMNVPGQTMISVSFIRVRWAWLALPVALVVVTSILLAIIAIKSHRSGVTVWKDDPLALLFHHIDGIDKRFLGSTQQNGPADIERLADQIIVEISKESPYTFARASIKPSTSGRRSSRTSGVFKSIGRSGRRGILQPLFSRK